MPTCLASTASAAQNETLLAARQELERAEGRLAAAQATVRVEKRLLSARAELDIALLRVSRSPAQPRASHLPALLTSTPGEQDKDAGQSHAMRHGRVHKRSHERRHTRREHPARSRAVEESALGGDEPVNVTVVMMAAGQAAETPAGPVVKEEPQ